MPTRHGIRVASSSITFACALTLGVLPGCRQDHIPTAPDEVSRSSIGVHAPLESATGSAVAPRPTRDVDSATAMESFEACWGLVNENHFDPTHNGVDWAAVRVEFAPRAAAVTTRAALRDLLNEMLARLGQSHFGVMPPGGWDEPQMTGEQSEDGRSGLSVRFVDDSYVVTDVKPGSPADAAGIQAGWVIDSIDGDSLTTAIGEEVPDHLRQLVAERIVEAKLMGEPEAAKSVSFHAQDDAPREATMTLERDRSRKVSFGVLPPITVELSHRELDLADWARCGASPANGASTPHVGYITFTAWFPSIAAAFDQAVDEHRSCDAIVIDLRGNPGGVGLMAAGFAGHFVQEPTNLGDMIARTGTIHFLAQPRTVAAGGREVTPFAGPLAILVDSQTGSTSEVFAGGMVDVGRAEVFGGPSAGAALPASLTTLPSGDVFLYAVADFRVTSGHSIEGVGVTPTIEPAPTLVDYRASPDPTLRQALHWIARGAPSRSVPSGTPEN